MSDSQWYCPMPFRSVYSEHDGVKPCCSYAKRFTGSIDEWLASDELEQLQQKFLRGEVDRECRFCKRQEENGFTSTRQKGLQDHPDFYTQTSITEFDYRSNNLCNFKCRSCYAGASSAWLADVKQSEYIKNLQPPVNSKLVSNNEKNKDWIANNIEQLQIITLAGGEPTLINEVKNLVYQLSKAKEKDRRIVIITNGSVFDEFWEEVTQDLGWYLVWVISLDAIGEHAEISRHGTNWADVDRNIKKIAATGKNLVFNTTVSNLNVLHLQPLQNYIRLIRQQKQEDGYNCLQTVKSVWMPEFMNPVNWPDDLKPMVLENLDQTINNESFKDSRVWLEQLREQIAQHKFDPALWQTQVNYNKELDRIRNEDFRTLIPMSSHSL